MDLTIRLSTPLMGEAFYEGRTLSGQRITVTDEKTFVDAQFEAPLTAGAGGVHMAVATLAGLEAGQHRFWVEDDGHMLWRSGVRPLGDEDQILGFHVLDIRGAETTHTKDMLTDQLRARTPIITSAEDGVASVDEANTITAVTDLAANVRAYGLGLVGSGYHGNKAFFEGDATGVFLGSSDFHFTYEIELAPSTGIEPDHLIAVTPREPLKITFHNPVIGFIMMFAQEKLNADTRQTIEDQLNAQIAAALADHLATLTPEADLVAQSTAVVNQIVATVDDPAAMDALEFRLLVSVPEALVTGQNGQSGCLGAFAFIAVGVAGAATLGLRGLFG